MLKNWFFGGGWFFFSWSALSLALFAQESAAPTSDDSLLDELEKIARADSGCFYALCEIYQGKSKTVVIHPANRSQNTYSIAKLFTVTAVGILEDRGLLDTDEAVYPIFEKKFPESFDPVWKQVRVRDVLQHRMGIESGFLDIDAEKISDWPSGDFLQIVLSRPLKYAPGTKSVYSDAAFYLASRIVSAKCGERLDDFLIRELLAPMQFSEYAFSKCPHGYPIGATGMYISAEDMAKLGLLYVQRGVYDGRRILSERFVEKVFAEEFELHPVGGSKDAYAKGGMNGQLLYLNRRTGRVVALHSFGGNTGKITDYLLEHDR